MKKVLTLILVLFMIYFISCDMLKIYASKSVFNEDSIESTTKLKINYEEQYIISNEFTIEIISEKTLHQLMIWVVK